MNKSYWIIERHTGELDAYPTEPDARDQMFEHDTLVPVQGPVDPMAMLKNPVTPYGSLIRSLRSLTNTTLIQMGQALGHSVSHLSSAEMGRIKVDDELIEQTCLFFQSAGLPVTLDLFKIAAQQERGFL